MSERAAAEEVAAERFVMVVMERIRNVCAGCDVASKPIAAVQIEDARSSEPGHHTSPPETRTHPPLVPHRAADASPLVHPDAELMAQSIR